MCGEWHAICRLTTSFVDCKKEDTHCSPTQISILSHCSENHWPGCLISNKRLVFQWVGIVVCFSSICFYTLMRQDFAKSRFLSGEATDNNFIVFGLTWQGLERVIYRLILKIPYCTVNLCVASWTHGTFNQRKQWHKEVNYIETKIADDRLRVFWNIVWCTFK
jgi:hypothetical protein